MRLLIIRYRSISLIRPFASLGVFHRKHSYLNSFVLNRSLRRFSGKAIAIPMAALSNSIQSKDTAKMIDYEQFPNLSVTAMNGRAVTLSEIIQTRRVVLTLLRHFG